MVRNDSAQGYLSSLPQQGSQGGRGLINSRKWLTHPIYETKVCNSNPKPIRPNQQFCWRCCLCLEQSTIPQRFLWICGKVYQGGWSAQIVPIEVICAPAIRTHKRQDTKTGKFAIAERCVCRQTSTKTISNLPLGRVCPTLYIYIHVGGQSRLENECRRNCYSITIFRDRCVCAPPVSENKPDESITSGEVVIRHNAIYVQTTVRHRYRDDRQKQTLHCPEGTYQAETYTRA